MRCRLSRSEQVLTDSVALTPQALDAYVDAVELPARQTTDHPAIREMFRYGAGVGSVILVYPSLDRAMDTARQHITVCEEKGLSVADGTCILASSLNASKGRFSRLWHAPPGGLWGCLILADNFLPPFRHLLSFVPGIACCEALHQEGASTASIRWVNDVLLQGKKQAGFLIEGFRSPVHGENYHLLGFGLNVNNSSFPDELQGAAVSLADFLGRPVAISPFTLSFLAKIRWWIGVLIYEEKNWLERGGGGEYEDEHPLIQRWRELSDTLGRQVLFGYDIVNNPEYRALAAGIAADGALILEHGDGYTSVEHSGEIRYLCPSSGDHGKLLF